MSDLMDDGDTRADSAGDAGDAVGQDREILQDDLTTYSLDDEDQLQPQDSLDDRGLDDVLDEGYSPAERGRGVQAFGTTAAEQAQGETIEQRLLQEEPDPAAAADLGGESERVGGDDPDSIPAERDFLGDPEVGADRSGRLVAPDEGARSDREHDLVAADVGVDGAAASPEEAAMHVVEEHVVEGHVVEGHVVERR